MLPAAATLAEFQCESVVNVGVGSLANAALAVRARHTTLQPPLASRSAASCFCCSLLRSIRAVRSICSFARSHALTMRAAGSSFVVRSGRSAKQSNEVQRALWPLALSVVLCCAVLRAAQCADTSTLIYIYGATHTAKSLPSAAESYTAPRASYTALTHSYSPVCSPKHRRHWPLCDSHTLHASK